MATRLHICKPSSSRNFHCIEALKNRNKVQRATFSSAGALGLSGGEWSAAWQQTESSKCVYLLNRLREIGAAPPLPPPRLPGMQRGVRWADGGIDEESEALPVVRGINDEPPVKVSGQLN